MKTLEEYIKDAVIYGYNLSINSSLAQKDVINYNFDTITKSFISKTVDDIKLSQPSDVSDEMIEKAAEEHAGFIGYNGNVNINIAKQVSFIQGAKAMRDGQIKPTIEGENTK